MKVIFITGPTACGKSSLALNLVRELKNAAPSLRAGIINCDSVQVYHGLKIGSAQPSKAEMAEIPHLLYGIIHSPETLTAGEFSRLFYQTLKDVEKNFDLLFAVGGSGFYIQAILKGMYTTPKADTELQQAIMKELEQPSGSMKLHEELTSADPKAAKRIHPNDHYRLIRAIEILRSGQSKISDLNSESAERGLQFPYPFLQWVLDVPRDQLQNLVNKRVEKMLQDGLVSEVQSLLDTSQIEWSPLRSVGYFETLQWLGEGSGNLKQLSEMICRGTMQLAKKQRTWFSRKQDYESRISRWTYPEPKLAEALTKVRSFID